MLRSLCDLPCPLLSSGGPTDRSCLVSEEDLTKPGLPGPVDRGILRAVDGELAPGPEGGDVPAPLRLDVFATVLHRQAADAGELLEFLAARLAAALPEAVKVSHRGPFGTGRVTGVRITLPAAELELRRLPVGALAATEGQVVGGIVLRRDPVAVDRWIDDLAAALADLAHQSESAAYALRSIVN